MAMKFTDLHKNLGLKIDGQMRNAATPDRFSQGNEVVDKKEQRRRDQAQGLIPFAVKIHKDLAAQLQQKATADGVALNDLVEGLLRKGLEG